MTRQELLDQLAAAGIHPYRYSLFGEEIADNYVLKDNEDGTYTVYYFERGNRWDPKNFGTEHEACEYLRSKFFK